MDIEPQRTSAVIAGIEASCPFCLARSSRLPKVGEQILIISGFATGTAGIVTKLEIPVPGRVGFLIRPEGAPQGTEQIVYIGSALFMSPDGFQAPDWFPPLNARETADLEEGVVSFCDACYANGTWNWDRRAYLALIYLIWRMRAPVSRNEVWNLLSHHGVPDSENNHAIAAFQDGLDLLIHANGRKSIKKKRVQSLS